MAAPGNALQQELNMYQRRNSRKWLPVLAVVGLLTLSTGCDPTLRASVEDGVISVSTAFFGSLLQALVTLGTEQATGTTTTTAEPNNSGTAFLADEAGQLVFA